MKRVTIMIRVSSDEQAKGYSLDDQLERLTEYCKRNGYEVVYIIREDHSAKTFDRPEWNKWYELVVTGKLKCDELIVTSWDRFSRDFAGAVNMVNFLRARGVVPQAMEQPIDYDIPESLFMLAVYLANPDVDNRRRSIKVRGGIRRGKKSGYWAQRPPLGYKTAIGMETKHIIVPDPETDWIIKHIFDGVEIGLTQKQIRTELADKGVTISRNNMCKVLRRVVYAGLILVPAKDNEPEQIIQGKHEALITEAQFFRVQKLLKDDIKQRNAAPKYAKIREDFHLRGLILCNSCGEPLTASASRGKSGKRYSYYHCNHCKAQRESVDAIHDAFQSLLSYLELGEEMRVVYESILMEMLGGNEIEVEKHKKILKAQIEQEQQRIENLQSLLMDGKLDADDYTIMKGRCADQINTLKQKLDALGKDHAHIRKLATGAFNLLSNLSESFKNADVELKQKIVCSIFPKKLTFDGKICRTPEINSAIPLIFRVGKGLGEKEKGNDASDCIHSPSAVRGGFEPPVRLLVRQFSKLLVSATHPPHQVFE